MRSPWANSSYGLRLAWMLRKSRKVCMPGRLHAPINVLGERGAERLAQLKVLASGLVVEQRRVRGRAPEESARMVRHLPVRRAHSK